MGLDKTKPSWITQSVHNMSQDLEPISLFTFQDKFAISCGFDN